MAVASAPEPQSTKREAVSSQGGENNRRQRNQPWFLYRALFKAKQALHLTQRPTVFLSQKSISIGSMHFKDFAPSSSFVGNGFGMKQSSEHSPVALN